jgi:hypothetical protein
VQLVDCGRPVHVGRHQERRLLLQLEPAGELAGRRGLTRALKADQQNERGRHRGVDDGGLFLAQQPHQLIVHDLDQLVTRPHVLEGCEADRLGLHPFQEIAGQVEADIGLEQDPADLPEPLLDRVFR